MARENDRPRRPSKPKAAGAARRTNPKTASPHRDEVSIPACIERAFSSRAKLLDDPATNAFRLFNGAADGIDGLIIEQFGETLIAQLHEDRLAVSENDVRDACDLLRKRIGARAVYRKRFPRNRSAALANLHAQHTSPEPWLGEPVDREFAIVENGLRLLVRPYDGYSVGIFLEHRDNRRRITRLAAGRSVLNTFAYTCGFSVAAAGGGASETVNVDASGKFLEWGRRNFSANGLSLDRHAFIKSDVLDFYTRARRQKRSFDVIVLDPPTFGRARRSKHAFALATDLQRLVDGAAELLNPGGHILLASNNRRMTRGVLERAVACALRKRGGKIVARPQLPGDFAGDPAYSKAVIARAGE